MDAIGTIIKKPRNASIVRFYFIKGNLIFSF